MESNKLRAHIDSSGLQYGTTDDGQAWCIKALHPSDPLTTTRGIPDDAATSSVMMNYQAAYTFEEPTAGGPWNFDMWVMPHPVVFGYASFTNGTGQSPAYFRNAQLTGTTTRDKTDSFLQLAEEFRLCYMSVTLVHNCSATTNQGMVAACQHSAVHRDLTVSVTGASLLACMPIGQYQPSDFPAFSECQAMPSAMIGNMRDGVYMPVKLTRTCQQWQSMRDLRLWAGTGTAVPSVNYAIPTSAASTYVPYGVQPVWNSGGTVAGDYTFSNMSTNSGYICGEGLDPASSVTAYFRVGIELRVAPLSALAPQQTLAPSSDEMALSSYFAIARKLKDAYPADYNDRAKLWAVVERVARATLPTLANALLPGTGQLVSPALDAVVKSARRRRGRKANRTPLSRAPSK